jgi:predicted MFS family arabinose efflux permease
MVTRALVRRYPVLGNRNFRLLLADRLLAPMAIAFSLVGVSFAVLQSTTSAAHPAGSTAALSYVLAAQLAPSLVFLVIGGVIADRMAPQLVIIGANVMVAVGEGAFGILVLFGHPSLWAMIGLETLTGSGVAIFYPASMALLPALVPAAQMQEASAISRLAMNAATTAGAALAGECVAIFGPGWALAVCGIGMLSSVPLLLAIKVQPRERSGAHSPNALRELRDGWAEFKSHTWLWVTVLQFTVVLAVWCGGFQVLGPAVAKAHLGGPAAWGAISAAEAAGLIAGGLASLRWAPKRPVLFVVICGGTIATSPLTLAMLLPLPVICAAAFVLGITIEMMSVVWTVTMATKIRPDMLARVSGYDGLGSMMGTPVGALAAGPIAAAVGVRATQFGAAAITLIASALALIPRDVRTMRATEYPAASVPAAADTPGRDDQAASASAPTKAAHSAA